MRENYLFSMDLDELLPAGNVARGEVIMAGSNWLLSMTSDRKKSLRASVNQLRVNARPAQKTATMLLPFRSGFCAVIGS